jgi:hypothetical protein
MSGPQLSDMRKYSVNRPGEIEAIRQPQYDSLLYPGAGATQLNFFQLPQGQGVTTALGAVVGSAKTIQDTNMELAGQLPAYKNFKLESIEILVFPGGSAAANTFTLAPQGRFNAVASAALLARENDLQTILSSGSLQFFIGSKSYLDEAPLQVFPPKTHLALNGSIASNSATVGASVSLENMAFGRPNFIEPVIVIPANQNFRVSLTWPGLVAVPSGFNARIVVRLDGYLFRNSQ